MFSSSRIKSQTQITLKIQPEIEMFCIFYFILIWRIKKFQQNIY